MSTDDMPPQPTPANLPAMTDRALLEELASSSRKTLATVDRLELTVAGLVGDGRITHERIGGLESRISRLEASTSVPPAPPPLTSERVRSMINGSPSQMDLEEQAKLAAEIVRGRERDQKIDDTLALATKAATKEDLEALAAVAATKDDVTKAAKAFETATQAQTLAILAGVSELRKNPVVRYAAAAILGAAVSYVTTCAKLPLPASAPQSSAITVPK